MLYGLTAVPRCDTEMCWALNKNQGKIACPDYDLDTMYTSGADLREGRTGSHILPPWDDLRLTSRLYKICCNPSVSSLLSKILDPPVREQAEKMSSILAIPFHDNVAEGLPQNLQRRRDFQSINSWKCDASALGVPGRGISLKSNCNALQVTIQ